MNRKKLFIGIGVVALLGAMAYANIVFKKDTGIEVTVEKIEKRDLEAIVSASGKIQPKRSVNISAETMGKVVGLLKARHAGQIDFGKAAAMVKGLLGA